MKRWWLRTLAILLMIPVLFAGVFVLVFDPNKYKPQIIEAVQEATGRTLTLRGPLRLSRSLWPTLEVNDVSLSNLPDGSRSDMAHAERIEGQISLLSLLRRQIDISRLTLIGPNILFEQVAGQPNWLFATSHKTVADGTTTASSPSSHFDLRIRAVHVQNGMVTWRLPARTKVVGIRALDYQQPIERGPFELHSTLVYADNQPFTFDAIAQPTGGVVDPWTTQLHFAAFDSVANATGTMDIAGHYDLQLDATSGALEKLNALLPEMGLPAIHQAILSTHIANGNQPGDLPVLGATKLHFDNADLSDRVAGLILNAFEATLTSPGAQARMSGAGTYAGTPFRLSAAVAIPTHPDGLVDLPIELKVNAANTNLALKGSLALRTLRFAGLQTQAALQTPALADLRPVLGRQLPALTDRHFAGKLMIPAAASPIRLEAVRLQTHQGDLEGDSTFNFDTPLTLAGRWRSTSLDLDELLAAFGVDLSQNAAPARIVGPVIPATELPWTALHAPTLDLDADVDALRFQDRIWHQVKLTLRLKNGHLQLGPLKLALPTGPLEIAMTADAASSGAPVSLSLHAPIPLALIAHYAELPGPVSGTIRVDARLRAAGRTLRDLAATLDGPFSIVGIDGQVSNAALIQLTSAALDALGIKVPARGEAHITCLGVAGTFSHGLATLRTIALETTYLSLAGAGQVDLGRETLALHLTPLAQVVGSPVAVPVVIQGPFRNIQGRLDADGLDKLGFVVDALFGGDKSHACANAGLLPDSTNGEASGIRR